MTSEEDAREDAHSELSRILSGEPVTSDAEDPATDEEQIEYDPTEDPEVRTR